MTNNWIDEENARASMLAKTGTTTNDKAPILVKTTKKPAPVRHIKSIYKGISNIYVRMWHKAIAQ